MTILLDLLGLMLSIAVFCACFERIRKISWRTSRPAFMLLYLGCMLWSLTAGADSIQSGIEWYQLLGLGGVLAGFIATRHRWRHGVPEDVTKPAPLGAPELSRNSTFK